MDRTVSPRRGASRRRRPPPRGRRGSAPIERGRERADRPREDPVGIDVGRFDDDRIGDSASVPERPRPVRRRTKRIRSGTMRMAPSEGGRPLDRRRTARGEPLGDDDDPDAVEVAQGEVEVGVRRERPSRTARATVPRRVAGGRRSSSPRTTTSSISGSGSSRRRRHRRRGPAGSRRVATWPIPSRVRAISVASPAGSSPTLPTSSTRAPWATAARAIRTGRPSAADGRSSSPGTWSGEPMTTITGRSYRVEGPCREAVTHGRSQAGSVAVGSGVSSGSGVSVGSGVSDGSCVFDRLGGRRRCGSGVLDEPGSRRRPSRRHRVPDGRTCRPARPSRSAPGSSLGLRRSWSGPARPRCSALAWARVTASVSPRRSGPGRRTASGGGARSCHAPTAATLPTEPTATHERRGRRRAPGRGPRSGRSPEVDHAPAPGQGGEHRPEAPPPGGQAGGDRGLGQGLGRRPPPSPRRRTLRSGGRPRLAVRRSTRRATVGGLCELGRGRLDAVEVVQLAGLERAAHGRPAGSSSAARSRSRPRNRWVFTVPMGRWVSAAISASESSP